MHTFRKQFYLVLTIMKTFTTKNRHGYSAKFSNFSSTNLVVASSQLYGFAGAGTLYFLENFEDKITEIRQFKWTDGLFDVVWSRNNENVVATCSGDGSIQLWDLCTDDIESKPVCTYVEHTSEVYSLDWGELSNSNKILSSSWDGTIKIWDIENCHNSLATYKNDSDISMVYSAAFAPHIPNIFSSVSTNGSLNLWNSLYFSDKPIITIDASHSEEAFTCNWSTFYPWLLATGGSDGLIKGWDIRYLKKQSNAIFEILGCEYAVRRVSFSPFSSNILISANFDCTTKIWDIMALPECKETILNHSEFVYGVNWNLNNQNEIVDCGWDSKVNIYSPQSLKHS